MSNRVVVQIKGENKKQGLRNEASGWLTFDLHRGWEQAEAMKVGVGYN